MASEPDVRMGNVLLGLDDEPGRINALRARGEFLWLDLDLDSPGAQRLGDSLMIPQHVVEVLSTFDPAGSIFRRAYVDADRVVFPFFCIRDPAAAPLGPDGMQPQEVHVLVTGECLVTVHHGPCKPLRELAGERHRVTRSEQHLVYTVLAQMVASVFEVLGHLSLEGERVEDEFGTAQTGRRNLAFVREGQSRLNRIRGRLAPQLAVFERLVDEIPQVSGLAGDEHQYFPNVRDQLSHAVGALDAASDALGRLLDLGLNRMTFLFTVVATVFLPLTFLAGFWGQNFDFLARHIVSTASFWVLGVGLLLLTMLGSLLAIRRQLGPREASERPPGS